MATFRDPDALATHLKKRFKNVQTRAVRGTGLILYHEVNDVLAEAADSGSGRLYARRTKSGRVKKSRKKATRGQREMYRASAPGQAPARNSGKLLGSIRITIRKTDAVIWTPVPYAKFLERGTRRMSRRSFMDKAVRRARPKVEAYLRTLEV